MLFWGSLNDINCSNIHFSMAMGVFTLYCNLVIKEIVTVITDPGITTPLWMSVRSNEDPLSLLEYSSSAFMLQSAKYCFSSISCHNWHVGVNDCHLQKPSQLSEKATSPLSTNVKMNISFGGNDTSQNTGSLSSKKQILLGTLITILTLLAGIIGSWYTWQTKQKHDPNV